MKKFLFAIFALIVTAGVVSYLAFFRNIEKTISVLRDLTQQNSYNLEIDCKVVLNPDEVLEKLIEKVSAGGESSLGLTLTGVSCGSNLDLEVYAGAGDSSVHITDFRLIDGTGYFNIDSIASLILGDVLESNLAVSLVYASLIEDRFVTWEQLKELMPHLAGITSGVQQIDVTWQDVMMFMIDPQHLFDPDLWTAIRVTRSSEDYSSYKINIDYFSELIGLDCSDMDAVLSFKLDEKKKNYDMKLEMSFQDNYGNQIGAEADATALHLEGDADIVIPEKQIDDSQIDSLKQLISSVLEAI